MMAALSSPHFASCGRLLLSRARLVEHASAVVKPADPVPRCVPPTPLYAGATGGGLLSSSSSSMHVQVYYKAALPRAPLLRWRAGRIKRVLYSRVAPSSLLPYNPGAHYWRTGLQYSIQ
eukprot:4435569-Pyramimonas_sp.AAC.2